MKKITLTGTHKLMTACDVRNFSSLPLPMEDNLTTKSLSEEGSRKNPVLLLHCGAVQLANLSNTFLPEVGFCVTVENTFRYTQPLQRLRTVSYRHVL